MINLRFNTTQKRWSDKIVVDVKDVVQLNNSEIILEPL